MKQIKVLAICLVVITVFCACGESSSAPAPSPAERVQQVEKPVDTVLIDTETIRVSYQKLYETAGIEAAYLQLMVENKTDKTVWVYLDNTTVNGYSVLAASGVPMTIQPGEKSKSPFILTYQQFDAESIEDITQIEFEVVQKDNETSAVIYQSGRISVPVSKTK